MTTKIRTQDLPANASHDDCAAVHAFLTEALGKPVRLKAGGVRRTGARMALLLAAARQQWDADSQGFEIVSPSEALRAGLARLGLTEAVLGEEGVQ